MATVIDQLAVEIFFKGDRRELDKFDQGIKNLKGRLDGLAKGFTIAGAGLTAALAGIGRVNLNFEDALNDIRVFSNQGEKEIKKIEDQARELGKGGRFDAKNVLEGQRALLQGQFSLNEVLAQMPHIVDSATASLTPLDQRAGEVVTILN